MTHMRQCKHTLDFALENPTEMANFYSAMAYPGSPLYLNKLDYLIHCFTTNVCWI